MAEPGGDFYRQLFEEVSDAVMVYDPADGVIVDANPAATALTGYDADVLRGSPVTRFSAGTPEEVEAAAAEIVDRAAEGTQRFEWLVERADGDVRTTEVALHRTTIGGEDRVLALLRDRTDEVSERAEREAERTRLTELTRSSPDVFWMFSADWERCLFVNDAYEAVFGRSTEALERDPTDFLAGVHPEDRETVTRAMERLSAGEAIDIEYRVGSAEGSERWVWAEGVPVLDETGAPIRHVGFTREITERKRLETQIATQNEQLSALTDNLPLILFELDEAGVFLQSTGRGLGEIGRESGAVVGQSIFELYEDNEPITDACRRALDGEEVHLTVDVGGYTFDASYLPTRDESGTVNGLIGVAVNVTEREALERELRLRNEQLDEFGSVVAHDLRGPLTAARGFLELGLESDDPAHFERVERAHERMVTLIEDLLTLARQGEGAGERESVDLEPLVRSVWEYVPGSPTLAVEGPLPTVPAHAARLEQLLTNLFRNAVDHGGEAVTVRVGPLADGAGFFVEDDGPGIPPEKRAQVFQFGYSESPDGTGLGLAIVRDIVTAHGWEVAVVDGRDGGARFEITGVGVAD